MNRLYFWIFLLVAGTGSFVSAEEPPDAKPQKQYKQAITINPLALLSMGIAGHYTAMIAPKTSVFVEGSYTASPAAKGWVAAGGARYHFGDDLKAKYVGLYYMHARLRGDLEVIIKGSTHKHELIGDPLWAIGAHYGKRWIWREWLTLGWRIGLGFGQTKFTWDPEPAQDLRLTKTIMDAVSPLDSEFTLGYAF